MDSAKTADTSDIVKVVDKLYLQKSYHVGQGHAFIEESIKNFSLNREQERAFRIIANHASSPHLNKPELSFGSMNMVFCGDFA